MTCKYEIHPAANLFPLMTEEELEGLIQDIKENGQQESVMFWKGKLVDGRNRVAACERLGIEVKAGELLDDTDPVKWVLSANLHRRHLDTGQKALVAVHLKKLLETEAKERSTNNLKKGQEKPDPEILPGRGDTRDKAAAAVGVSGRLVDFAVKVTEKGTPELQAAVTSGSISVSKAAKIADAPKAEQAALIKVPRKARANGKKQSDDPVGDACSHEWDDDGDCIKCKRPNDSFDTARLAAAKNGAEKKELDDEATDRLFGVLIRRLHDRNEVVGGAGYKLANSKLSEAYDAWKGWQAEVAK
jgi:hypothetical protein